MTSRWHRWPRATAVLALALCAAFVLDLRTRVDPGVGPEELPWRWVLDGASPRPWQYVTHAFVHADTAHLTGNLVLLVGSGAAVEWRVGAARTALAFLALCVGAAAGFHLGDGRDLYGASGAAAGMLSLAAVLWADARDPHPLARAIPLVVSVAYFGIGEGLPALTGHASPAWRVHLCGALAGLLLGAGVIVWRTLKARIPR